uniref:Uncharacterized protein MANES_04G026300 n=1 Tax=Rhizophora mucronata TaxID=61149 RepID=A0A2P2JJI5_RHIMU
MSVLSLLTSPSNKFTHVLDCSNSDATAL